MTPNEAAIMWEYAFRFWPKNSVFRYFARRPSDNAVFGSTLRTPAELVRVTEWADAEGYNSYWQPNPTRNQGGYRCSTDDITHVCYFMIDIDPIGEKANPESAMYTFDDAARIALDDVYPGLENATIIYSGRGIQLLFPLVPTCTTSVFSIRHQDTRHDMLLRDLWPLAATHALKDILRLAGGPHMNCTIDTSVTDLPRVMRMPFTINTKTNTKADLREVAPSPSMSLLPRIVTGAPSALFIRTPPTERTHSTGSWLDYLPRMTAAGRIFCTQGAEEGDRHRGAVAAMMSLVSLGANQDQVTQALALGAAMCKPPMPLGEIHRMVTGKFSRLTTPRSVVYSSSEGEPNGST